MHQQSGAVSLHPVRGLKTEDYLVSSETMHNIPKFGKNSVKSELVKIMLKPVCA